MDVGIKIDGRGRAWNEFIRWAQSLGAISVVQDTTPVHSRFSTVGNEKEGSEFKNGRGKKKQDDLD